jgi:hypothetical protein
MLATTLSLGIGASNAQALDSTTASGSAGWR